MNVSTVCSVLDLLTSNSNQFWRLKSAVRENYCKIHGLSIKFLILIFKIYVGIKENVLRRQEINNNILTYENCFKRIKYHRNSNLVQSQKFKLCEVFLYYNYDFIKFYKVIENVAHVRVNLIIVGESKNVVFLYQNVLGLELLVLYFMEC